MLSPMKTTPLDQLATQPLRKSADSALRKALMSGDEAAFQRAVVKGWGKAHQKLPKAVGGPKLATFWSGPALAGTPADQELLSRIQNVDPGKLCRVIAEFIASDEPNSILQALLAAEILVRDPDGFTAEQFSQVYTKLAHCDTSALSTAVVDSKVSSSQSVLEIVAEAELPFVMSLLFAPFQFSKLLYARGVEYLADYVEAASDTDGTLDAEIAEDLSQWLAPFIRVQAWAKAFKQPWARAPTQTRWNQCLTDVAACTVSTGFLTEPAANPGLPRISSPELFFRAVELAELPDDSPLPPMLKSLARGPAKKNKSATTDSSASHQSDWAAAAVLRNRLTADADAISVHWKSDTPTLNLAALGSQLLTGDWETQITADGQTVTTAGSWVCTCWFQDEEVAFAELEAGSADGVRHVRHVMLSLTDHFAVITNTISAPNADVDIHFASRLPLTGQFAAEANPITRELSLSDGRVAVRAVPCWLADDRIQSTAGDFFVADGALRIRAEGRGGVAAPLLLDWHPDRVFREADWNNLTITEDSRVNSTFDACAFRVRVGRLQLLLYRSLRRGEKLRSVLGYHTGHETVYGHIRNSGKIDPLVLVESDA